MPSPPFEHSFKFVEQHTHAVFFSFETEARNRGERRRLLRALPGDDDGTDTHKTRSDEPLVTESVILWTWSMTARCRRRPAPSVTAASQDAEDRCDDGKRTSPPAVPYIETSGGALTGTRISECCALAHAVMLVTGTIRSFGGSSSLRWWTTSSGSICSRSPQRTPR